MNDQKVNPIIRDFIRTQKDIDVDRYSNKGSFGELYFGRRKILKDRVALKFYEFDVLGINHSEPLLLKTINHRNILSIYDARILDNKIAYYLTPEISGGDLQNFIENNTINTEEALLITQGILKGLSALHKSPNNFVHRDLKSLNILIDLKSKTPYISDFGILKRIPINTDYVTASKSSPLYRPPEVIIDGKYYFCSDIYQVGIILYQLLDGYFPFDIQQWMNPKQRNEFNGIIDANKNREYAKTILDNLILKGNIINQDKLPPYIDKRLKRIIKKATNVEITKRYQSCTEFLKAIYDYMKCYKKWWEISGIYYAYDKNKNKYYEVKKSENEYILSQSSDSLKWRKKNVGSNSLSDIINIVNDL
ncbi:MAG: serine/threonine-protein kinase [Ignavibacteria bacterium]|nr:serine/threonine-protein kinase [Ignavibacteria bacterium]